MSSTTAAGSNDGGGSGKRTATNRPSTANTNSNQAASTGGFSTQFDALLLETSGIDPNSLGMPMLEGLTGLGNIDEFLGGGTATASEVSPPTTLSSMAGKSTEGLGEEATANMPTEQIASESTVDMTLHPSGIIPILQNIVSTVNLECRLDLKHIALHARNAEYNPKRFAAVIMRIREPKTTALIFASGKMVVTGAKSEELSRLAARKYARIIQKLGFSARFTDFKIQNIVGSCDIRFPIRLEGLAFSHGNFSSYEPELFPGLIYRMVRPKIVLLIFVSGKIVLTGARVREEIYQAFENIYPVLTEFRKP